MACTRKLNSYPQDSTVLDTRWIFAQASKMGEIKAYRGFVKSILIFVFILEFVL